jgi:hypothetical protein
MKKRIPEPFNSPFELGIRMVFLLYALRPHGADLQKLVLLDYALVYSADLGGPESMHTPVPQRGSELYTRRSRIQEGLYLMSSKDLVDARFEADGVTYFAGPNCRLMVAGLTTPYGRLLEERAAWVTAAFGQWQTDALTRHFEKEGRRWGAEVEYSAAG